MKQLLTQAPELLFPKFSRDLAIHVYPSQAGAGAFHPQQKGDDLAVAAYFSQRCSDCQRHFYATLKEYYTLVLVVQHWRPYIWGRYFVSVTGQAALRYLYPIQDASNMLTRWAVALQTYD